MTELGGKAEGISRADLVSMVLLIQGNRPPGRDIGASCGQFIAEEYKS